MNHALHYERLIERARCRVLPGYSERHHVLPRCCGGDDSTLNLVDLTAEEHFVAHQLLIFIYPNKSGLVHAATWMSKRCSGNKAYGWLRRKAAVALGDRMRGKAKSLEHRARIGDAHRGKKYTAEALENIRAGVRARVRVPMPQEQREKIGARFRGTKLSPETRAKISAAKKGKVRSADHCQHISDTKRGKKRPPFTDATRAKMSAWQVGKKFSAETKARISAGCLAAHAARRAVAGVSP